MFSFGDKSNTIDKARRVSSKGEPSKAVEILKNAFTQEESDLPLILEIMHTYLIMDKLNEVTVWAKKGEMLSAEAARQVLSEMEDLYYGRGKPDQLAEYLIEKKAEKRDLEDVYDILREMTPEGRNNLQEREQRTVDNILAHKEKYKGRDLSHLYSLCIALEGKESKQSVDIFNKIIEKHPEELEIVIRELRRANQECYGDEWLLFGLGHVLLKIQNYEEGISKIRDALDRNEELFPEAFTILDSFKDKSKEVLDYLSELYIESGKEEDAIKLIEVFETEEAIKKYQRMVKKNPDNSLLHKNLAEAYLKKKRYSESLQEFLASLLISPDEEIGKKVKKIQGKLPDELDPYLYLSSIYRKLGWTKEAVKQLKKAFEIAPSGAPEILEKLDQIIKDSKESAEALLLKAKLLSREGDVDKALGIFKDLAQKPDGLKTVKGELNKLKKENPHNTEVKLTSLMFRIPEEPEEAAQRIDQILAEEPDYVPLMLTEFDRWVRGNPDLAPNFLYFYELLDRKNFPLFTYPFALGELKRLTEDFDNAEKFYIEALSEVPERFNFLIEHLQKYRDKEEIRRTISSLYFHKGEYKKGCNEIKMAAKQFPEDVSNITSFLIKHIHSKKANKYLYQTLTEILLDNGYYEEAIKWGKKALSSLEAEEQGELSLNLSKANAKVGNYSEASKLAQKAWSISNSLIDQAILVLEQVREKGTPEPDILMSLYELYKEEENARKGIICLDEVLNQRPSMADIIVGEYEKLIEIAPIDALLRIYYGKAKLLMGDETGIPEIEKGLRFDPSLNEEALKALEGHKDPEIANKALLIMGNIFSKLGRKEEALKTFIESYWKNEDERKKALAGIESLFSSFDLSEELVDKLFDVYHQEGRNTRLVNLIDFYFDGSNLRGKFLTQKIDNAFKDNIPLPLQVSHVMIDYSIGEKEKAAPETEYLLKEYPDVAEKLKDIIDPDDSEMLPLLIKINLVLSNWEEVIHYIKQLAISERLPFYEQLLDQAPDNEEAMREAGYLYFLTKDQKKAKLYLSSISNPERKEGTLLWWLGKDIEITPEEIKDSRIEILHDMIAISESPKRRAQLYIELREYEKAYEEIKHTEGDEKEILISKIELQNCDYSNAYQRLTRLEQTDEVKLLRYYAALHKREYGLALGLISGVEMNPARKKKYISSILKDSANEYSRLNPTIGR